MERDQEEWVLSQEEVWDIVQYLCRELSLQERTILHSIDLLPAPMDPHTLMLMAPSTSLEEEEVRAEGSMAVEGVVEEDDGNNPVFYPIGEPLSFLTIK
jgi:hypothetical protein